MNQDKILFTPEGFNALKEEYRQLVEEKRPRIVERLSESRQAGDLAENSEYLQAKEELSFIDGRINELKEVLSRASLVNHNHKNCCKVGLGCKVTVMMGNKISEIFHLVGDWEVDPASKKISYTSPLGKALFGRKVGDKIEFEAPAGKIVYHIIKIE